VTWEPSRHALKAEYVCHQKRIQYKLILIYNLFRFLSQALGGFDFCRCARVCLRELTVCVLGWSGTMWVTPPGVTPSGVSLQQVCDSTRCVTPPGVSLHQVCHSTRCVTPPGVTPPGVSLHQVCDSTRCGTPPGVSLHQVCYSTWC
jgi:hypothetical protein